MGFGSIFNKWPHAVLETLGFLCHPTPIGSKLKTQHGTSLSYEVCYPTGEILQVGSP